MNLVFLHGALGSRSQWENIAKYLPENNKIHTINFPQHGNSKENLELFTIDSLAYFVDSYIQQLKLKNCILVGYSLGGYVALWLAAQKPKYLQKVVTLATKFTWQNDIIAQENSKLTLENLLPIKDKLLAEHGANFENLIANTHQIIGSIAQNNLNKDVLSHIEVPVLLMVGENDKMVTQQETIEYGKFIINSKIEILPQQPHIIQKMDGELVKNNIINFLNL